jgi:hypothetical protein
MNAARVQQWRRWAPFGLLLVAPAVGAVAELLASGPRGHWSGHVGSGAAATGQLLAVVAGAVLARRRLNLLTEPPPGGAPGRCGGGLGAGGGR